MAESESVDMSISDMSDEKLGELIFRETRSNIDLKELRSLEEVKITDNINYDDDMNDENIDFANQSSKKLFTGAKFKGMSTAVQMPIYKGSNPFLSSFAVSVFIMWFWAFLATRRLPPLVPGENPPPLSKWRRYFRYPILLGIRFLLLVAGFFWMPTSDYRKHKGDSKKTPRVLVCNHISVWDSFKIFYECDCSAALKAELFYTPILKTVFRALECVPIWRLHSKGRKTSIELLRDRCLDKDENLPPLLIFPEGTTHINEVLISFARGAFVAGIPVQPIVIQYPYKHFDNFLGDEYGLIFYLWWTLNQFYSNANVTYLEEYYPNQAEIDDPLYYGRNVRSRMAEYLNVEVTEHTFGDLRLRLAAAKAGVKSINNLEMKNIQNILHVEKDQIKILIKKFKEFDIDNTGEISFENFCEKLGIDPITYPKVTHLFSLFDSDQDGKLNFREFITGMCVCDRNLSSEDTFRVLFHLFSVTSEGIEGITCKGMTQLFELVLHFSIQSLHRTLWKEATIKIQKMHSLKKPQKEIVVTRRELDYHMRTAEMEKEKELHTLVKQFINILFSDTDGEDTSMSYKQFSEKLIKHSDLAQHVLSELFEAQFCTEPEVSTQT